jgi:DNA-binding CsgD family transcriptional regulator
MEIGYSICFVAAVGLLIAYSLIVKNKEFWMTMLYISITVVNLGYLLMSLANTVGFALFANDIAYLGSIFLSMCMFLTIVRLCGFEIKKSHVITCLSLAVVMYAIIVSSPMIPLYYKSVDLVMIDGAAKLVKEYGVLHPMYMIYLLAYFAAMIGTILHSVRKKKVGDPKLAGFIAAVVCSNLLVWLFEKLVNWEYEFLSVTYIGSELLLMLVYWMMQDYIHKTEVPQPVIMEKQTVVVVNSISKVEKINRLLAVLPSDKTLTAKEIEILGELVEGKTRKDIAAAHHITENTVKTHVTHIYEKFEVSSKDALLGLVHSQPIQ